MRLAINAEHRSVRVDTGDGIVQVVHIPLIKADREHHTKLRGKPHAHAHRLVLHHRLCIMIEVIPALLAKIFPLKKFRQKDHICSLCRRLSHHSPPQTPHSASELPPLSLCSCSFPLFVSVHFTAATFLLLHFCRRDLLCNTVDIPAAD